MGLVASIGLAAGAGAGPASATESSAAEAPSAAGAWSGYVVSGGPYYSASADFTVPSATCSQGPGESGRWTGFWVGVEAGSEQIAQNGIIVSCVQGEPEYQGNFDNLSGTIVQDDPQPMYPGDTVQSSVICWYGLCAETNQDITQNWTGYYVMIVPGGGFSGLIGAVAGESGGGGVTTGTVQVTNAMVNGTPIGQQNAQNDVQNPANYGSTASLVPTPLDATGMGFQLSWNATTGS